jgi:hypothetical protein
MARCLRQLMLGNNNVARRDFVWRQAGLKRHLPSRLPNDADDSASLCSYVVQLVPESHWLIADSMDSVLLASHGDPPSGSRNSYHGPPRFEVEPSHALSYLACRNACDFRSIADDAGRFSPFKVRLASGFPSLGIEAARIGSRLISA